jgi:diguanylate cyclase (GGDEF)-like protein
MDRLVQEMQRARRLGQPISLLMADLDHFKRVNDQLGHQAGDRALREFAALVKGSVREVDLVGRYGGEEFAVVLLDCAMEASLMVAGKIRRTVKQGLKHAPFDSLGGLTVSLGAAQMQEGMGPEELIALADRALYQAKANGRDRVEPQPVKPA